MKPRKIILMGLRRSGKSSIQKVVFYKMPPNETLFLESTSKLTQDHISSFIDFSVWDFPGQVDVFDAAFDFESIFTQVGALIFVIDAQDDYLDALARLHVTVARVVTINPNICIEVFIHKVDGLSDEFKIDTQRDIQQRTQDELADIGLENVPISFHLTSIFDHSIFEAFSRVIQKLIPQLPTLENLLNIFCSNSLVEKAYLFDVLSKIYVATDSSPVDVQSYEICSDFIDVILDIGSIYGRSSQLKPGHSPEILDETSSVIRLSNDLVLFLREMNQYLALICIVRADNFEKSGLIEYNVQCLQTAIQSIFSPRT
ncbi:GTP-binding protein gtr2 [Schizosaccharomyces pombe]|uniref:GTP-binding protein gtr2 n=1 Tax=Schizosaccharomyces pombe (strain 972 / ATCC 24843) TaxID=284812 RepID=RAGCD_SCHPO|nr:putative Gtr1/RagA G protein Gtr2 [Schizosaccharomyces pombe]O74544.1 RecName: Full=GTP-binding protein gtr2 [Schizosaccharomyces pombe 972h-]CAA20709.1 Gtr1/RagA G protein Gtr2 (predicted) [Schizosaccharomyces pombe]|eukprot:NP_588251.1 putative Gtr1/RagA G protein Gtr2 [Schizosaccharomyces pombe]